jgi:hypothetical protein
MRPGALTQAARSAATSRDAGAKGAPDSRQRARTALDAPGEQRTSRTSRTPRTPRPARPPRRVSGPISGKAGASPSSTTSARRSSATPRAVRPSATPRGVRPSLSGAVAAAVALPLPFRPQPARERPRPVRERPQPVRDRAPKAATGIRGRIGAVVLSLPDHHLLDRAIRGRVWIPLLGVLLAGIVATQVEILKLGASMGRSVEQTSSLTSQNELLRDNVAALSDDQRIERLATTMGMVLPPPGAVGYLTAGRGGDVARAAANIHTPDTAGFLALAPSNGALVTGPGTSMLPSNATVLAQAGTPGSATPTTNSSPTQAVPSAGSANSTGATTSTSTSATQAPPAEQAPPTTTSTDSQAPTTSAPTTSTDAQSATTAPQPTQPTGTDTQSGTQGPATGAAGIGPATSTQPSSGG